MVPEESWSLIATGERKERHWGEATEKLKRVQDREMGNVRKRSHKSPQALHCCLLSFPAHFTQRGVLSNWTLFLQRQNMYQVWEEAVCGARLPPLSGLFSWFSHLPSSQLPLHFPKMCTRTLTTKCLHPRQNQTTSLTPGSWSSPRNTEGNLIDLLAWKPRIA